MGMKRWFWVLLICGLGWWFSPASIPTYTFNFEEPKQDLTSETPIVVQGIKMYEEAEYHIQALVLSREDYKYDSLAKFIPMDLVLAWGPASNARLYKKIQIDQRERYYWWWVSTLSDIAPYNLKTIVDNTANTHIIPLNAEIENICKQIKPYDVVTLDGYLVNVPTYGLVTSLSRTDSGPGACEIMVVTQALVQKGSLVMKARN